MGVESDFSDVDQFFQDGTREVEKEMIDVGDEAKDFAVKNGNYKDHTGHLRKSNDYDVDEPGLTLENKADYASYVESKGFDVISNAALFAEKKLKEEFE
jgi:hypothetical protein